MLGRKGLKEMKRYVPIAVAVVLMIGVAVVQGYWTDRWGKFDSGEVVRRTEALKHVPLEFGTWKGVDTELDQQQLKVAKVSGVVQRTYTNTKNGMEVSIYLATGKARNISVHTPDKCYEAAGFRMAEDALPVEFKYGDPPREASSYMAHFRKEEQHGPPLHLHIYWTWNADNQWEAPGAPKIKFAKYPALYKLYVIRQLHGADSNLKEDPSITFLKDFLPVLDQVLYEPSSAQPASPPAKTAA